MKVCSRPDCALKGAPQPIERFSAANGSGALRNVCRDCRNRDTRIKRGTELPPDASPTPPMPVAEPPTPDARPTPPAALAWDGTAWVPAGPSKDEQDAEARRAAQQRRLESDYAALDPGEDFDTSVANDEQTGLVDAQRSRAASRTAAKEKRQEYSEAMGKFANALQNGTAPDQDLGRYIGALAEQERRFGNRRLARKFSLAAAHNELARELFKQTAREYFSGHVTPTGYAARQHPVPEPGTITRSVVALWSDLHLGANMDARSNPIPFRATEEARRFEYIVRQVLDYKPQYRANSEHVALINGDVIDGLLLHDQRAGIPLTEQKAVFWHFFRNYLGLAAQQFPLVRVFFQPGNHGRNVARHPGRATEDKWDGIEWDMYYALQQMCSSLPNVSFDLPFQAIGKVDLHGQYILLTHGDTEVKLGDPDTKARENAAQLDRINSTLLYGVPFARGAAGHYHKARFNPWWIFNPALVPPNGHARTSGYIGEPCGQTIWEAVEGYPVGDMRAVFVGEAQDRDERLGKLITPFRFTT